MKAQCFFVTYERTKLQFTFRLHEEIQALLEIKYKLGRKRYKNLIDISRLYRFRRSGLNYIKYVLYYNFVPGIIP